MAQYLSHNGFLHVETEPGTLAPAVVPLVVNGGFLCRLVADQVAALSPPTTFPLPEGQLNALRQVEITASPPIALAPGQSVTAQIDWGSTAEPNPGTGLYGWLGGLSTALGRLLTDDQLRASPVPVSGTWLTDTQLRASPVPVSGTWLTDTQLRASPVPVSGTWLTDTQLRASPVPVSVQGAITFASEGLATSVLQRFVPVAIDTVNVTNNWATLASYEGRMVEIQNLHPVELEYRRGGTGPTMRIPAQGGRIIPLAGNSNEISVRRADSVASPLAVNYEVMA